MTNEPQDTQPEPAPEPEAPAEATPPAADAQPVPPPERPKARLRDRVFGLRAVVAVGLAALILGGVGGAAIGVATGGDGDHQRRGPGQLDFRDGDGRRPEGLPGGPGGAGVPPTTAPDDQVEPDSSGDSGSDSGASNT